MSLAYPSGQLQKAILETLSFKGQTVITHGVGLSNFNKIELHNKKHIVKTSLFDSSMLGEFRLKKILNFSSMYSSLFLMN